MPATNFTDGVTTVLSTWLNKHFGPGGHVHDGVDQDGSAPKVSLADHVDHGSNAQATKTNDNATSVIHSFLHTGAGFVQWLIDRIQLESLVSLAGTHHILMRNTAAPAQKAELRNNALAFHTWAWVDGLALSADGKADFNGNGGGVASVTYTGGGTALDYYEVTLSNACPSTDYAALVTVDESWSTAGGAGTGLIATVDIQSTTVFRVRIRDAAGTSVSANFSFGIFCQRV